MFLTTMAQTGQVAIPHPEQDPPELRHLLENEAVALEAQIRLDYLLPTPAFHLPAAVWAAEILYRSCQLLVFRDLDEHAVSRAFNYPPPADADPSICYSVDVAFRFLPDLYQLAGGISPDDPLVLGLKTIGQNWPLSSVGMPISGELDISAFIEHSSLRELYLSRILERRDRSRLGHSVVRAALRQAVGAYHELAPELIAATSMEEPREN